MANINGLLVKWRALTYEFKLIKLYIKLQLLFLAKFKLLAEENLKFFLYQYSIDLLD